MDEETPETHARNPPSDLQDEEILELVASIVLERYPALVAFEELMVELGGRVPSPVVHDAIDELERLGLMHCLSGFAFASWRAVRAKQLGI